MDFQIDKFTINIDLSNGMITSAVLIISKIATQIDGNIHVIDYVGDSIHKYFTISNDSKPEFIENTKEIIPKLIFVDDAIMDIEWIKEYVNRMDSMDLVFINGAEKLLRYSEIQPLFMNSFRGKTNTIHFSEQENWKELLSELDAIYGDYQNSVAGIVTNIFTDTICRKIIVKELENSENMSIMSMADPRMNYDNVLIQHEILENISKEPLDKAMSIIENRRNKLGDRSYYFYMAIANYKNGNLSEAINLMDEQYENLLKQDKLILANLYIEVNDKDNAERILMELVEEDRYLHDLIPSFLRLYEENTEKYLYWLEQGMKYTPNCPAIIELNATFLSQNEKYEDAANEFRRLGTYINRDYYELVARMNEILAGKIVGDQNIKKYVYECFNDNPDLKNEGIYRLANYYLDVKKSDYLCFKCLEDAEIAYDRKRSTDIVKMKMAILKDEKRAAKVLGKLKPFNKDRDAEKIARVRAEMLVTFIQILAGFKGGYLFWREFLESQNNGIWNRYAYKLLIDILPGCLDELEKRVDSSKIYLLSQRKIQGVGDDLLNNPEQTFVNLIRLMRSIKVNYFYYDAAFDSDEQFVKSILTPAEVLNDNTMRIVCRYYISIIFAVSGKHQEANNNALFILELINILNEKDRILALYLGLLAWGHSQYCMGRYTEGIFCVLSAMKYCVMTNEAIPFIEEGINVISKFISECMDKSLQVDAENWKVMALKVDKYNSNLMRAILIQKYNSEKYLEKLKRDIEECSNIDTNWAENVINVVAIYAKKGMTSDALKFINMYGKNTIKLLEKRMDIRFQVLYDWAVICFSSLDERNNLYQALNYIEIAYQDIEEKRRVSHREERGSIGAQSNKILKLHLDICCTILNFESTNCGVQLYLESRIDEIVSKLSPRSIVEQKNYYNTQYDVAAAKKLEEKYNVINEEYKLLIKNGADIGTISEKAKASQEILEILKKTHPHFAELKTYTPPSVEEIQCILKKREILYQNILTKYGVIEIVISSNNVIRSYRGIDKKKSDVSVLSKEFSEAMQGQRNIDSETLHSDIYNISKIIAESLISYVCDNEVDRIFYLPDYELNMFPASLISTDKFSLIENVQSIVNILDYTSILEFNRNVKMDGVINRCVGNEADSEIHIISKYLKSVKMDCFMNLDNKSDDISNIRKAMEEHSQFNAVAIYGHGISDPIAGKLDGARGIEGKNHIFALSDLIDGLESKIFILISCRAGTPNNMTAEESCGTWATLLEKFRGTIVCCKWDVYTNKTVEFLKRFFELSLLDDKTLDNAINIVQREMKQKYPHEPQYWAGIEIWNN